MIRLLLYFIVSLPDSGNKKLRMHIIHLCTIKKTWSFFNREVNVFCKDMYFFLEASIEKRRYLLSYFHRYLSVLFPGPLEGLPLWGVEGGARGTEPPNERLHPVDECAHISSKVIHCSVQMDLHKKTRTRLSIS